MNHICNKKKTFMVNRYFEKYTSGSPSTKNQPINISKTQQPITLFTLIFYFLCGRRKNMERFTNLRVILAQGPC